MAAIAFSGAFAVSLLQHPAFQSLLLPGLLALLCVGGLRVWRPRWAPWGASLALVLALAVWPGLAWPATAGAQKLPWVAVAALAVGLIGDLPRTAHPPALIRPWVLAVLLWPLAAAWLMGVAEPAALALATVAGQVVLAAVAWSTHAPLAEPTRAAGSAAAFTVGVLGLGGMAAAGGSLLLAQLSAMLAVVSAVWGLWVWWRPEPGVGVTPAALLSLTGVGLALAALMVVSGQAHPLALGLLALGLLSPWWPAAWSVLGARARPWLVAVLAALPVAAAVLANLVLAPAHTGASGSDGDDAYYTPQWR